MMTEEDNYRLHAHVEGQVQGVGFRYFVLRTAQTQGLTGWVRNRFDGRVEVMAEGKLQGLNQLLAELRRGPLSSEVWNVDYQFEKPGGDYNRFSVLSTG